LGGLASGHRTQESWNHPDAGVDFFDLKGVLESLFQVLLVSDVTFKADNTIPYLHPGIAAKILVKGEPVGSIGEGHPHVIDNFEISKKIVVFEIDFGKIINYCDFKGKQAKPLPKFPAVYRDIALITGSETESQAIAQEIASANVRFLKDIRVFDVYEGENIPPGRKSLAYRMKFQAPDRSLTDEEVNRYYDKIVARLTKRLDVSLRT
jgi:phenylalanyl-tRNA synthetase beta chain